MKNQTYESELDILHFYQVWISLKIQQKKQGKPKFNPTWIFDFFPVYFYFIWKFANITLGSAIFSNYFHVHTVSRDILYINSTLDCSNVRGCRVIRCTTFQRINKCYVFYSHSLTKLTKTLNLSKSIRRLWTKLHYQTVSSEHSLVVQTINQRVV